MFCVLGKCFLNVQCAKMTLLRFGDVAKASKKDGSMTSSDILLVMDGHSHGNAEKVTSMLNAAMKRHKGPGKLFPSRAPTQVRMLYHHRELLQNILQSRKRESLSCAVDPLETLYLARPRARSLPSVSRPLDGSELTFESNLARGWCNLGMQTLEERRFSQVKPENYLEFFGRFAKVADKDAAENKEDQEEEAREDEEDEQDGAETTEAGSAVDASTVAEEETKSTARFLWPWTGPENFYRNLFRAYGLAKPDSSFRVCDFTCGSGLALLACMRDGICYSGYVNSPRHKLWVIQRTILMILVELILGVGCWPRRRALKREASLTGGSSLGPSATEGEEPVEQPAKAAKTNKKSSSSSSSSASA